MGSGREESDLRLFANSAAPLPSSLRDQPLPPVLSYLHPGKRNKATSFLETPVNFPLSHQLPQMQTIHKTWKGILFFSCFLFFLEDKLNPKRAQTNLKSNMVMSLLYPQKLDFQ